VRYVVGVEVGYTALGDGGLTEAVRVVMARALSDALELNRPKVAVAGLTVTVRESDVLVIRAELAGATVGDLTSPLDALTRLDSAVLAALVTTGLFEEFDVARRQLTAGPS
jgi:hypothetical protein